MVDDRSADDGERAQRMQRVVLRKSLRRQRARRTRDDSIWSWLGTFGIVGWTVTVPTLLGLALGLFLDDRIDSSFSFAITFLVLGAVTGVSMAWRWVSDEGSGDDR